MRYKVILYTKYGVVREWFIDVKTEEETKETVNALRGLINSDSSMHIKYGDNFLIAQASSFVIELVKEKEEG